MIEQPNQAIEQPTDLLREAAIGMFAHAFSLTSDERYSQRAKELSTNDTTEGE